MRIEALVNGTHVCTSGLAGRGYLNAHVNLSERADADESDNTLNLVAIETHEDESIYLDWPTVALAVGDIVTLKLLADGEASEPVSTRAGSESPSNLLTDVPLAQELVSACARFETDLLAILSKAKTVESPEEHAKLMRAVADVAAYLGDKVLYPVYRRHPSLIPEQLRGEIL